MSWIGPYIKGSPWCLRVASFHDLKQQSDDCATSVHLPFLVPHKETDDLNKHTDHRRKATDSEWSPGGHHSSQCSANTHDGISCRPGSDLRSQTLPYGTAAPGGAGEGVSGQWGVGHHYLLASLFLHISCTPSSLCERLQFLSSTLVIQMHGRGVGR